MIYVMNIEGFVRAIKKLTSRRLDAVTLEVILVVILISLHDFLLASAPLLESMIPPANPYS